MLPHHATMEDLTVNTLADAIDQHGEAQVQDALNRLTRLSEGRAPGGWGQEEPIEENNQEPATKKARKRLPRETIQSWSPCPHSARNEAYGLEELGGRYKDYDPQQCFDTNQNIHSSDFNHPHDDRCDGTCIPWDGKSTFTSSSFATETIQNSHHHLDEINIQKTLSKDATKETSASLPGTTSSATATRPVLRTRTTALPHWHIAMSKTGATVTHPLEPASPSARMHTESESSLLETAVCNATTSLYDEIHEFSAEERIDSKP